MLASVKFIFKMLLGVSDITYLINYWKIQDSIN